jgi:hypothetical protein
MSLRHLATMERWHLRYSIGIVDAGSMALAGRRLHASQRA